MSIIVTATSFPPGSGVPVATSVVPYTRAALVANCVVAGRPWQLSGGLAGGAGWGPAPADAAAFAANEALEVGGIAQLLFACLEQPPGAPIAGTEYLHLLESTEKGQASARLGAGITAMLAWTVLGVPALHHVRQVPDDIIGLVGGSGKSRPDYIGRVGAGAPYSVFEAKGTTGAAFSQPALVNAKGQAETIGSVGGVPIDFAVACIGRIPLAPASIEGTMIDPPADAGGDLPQEALEGREVLRYGPIARAIASDRPVIAISGTETEEPLELFPMGTAGFFGAVAPVVAAARELLSTETTFGPADADERLEASRDSIVDSRLPPLRRDAPNAHRRAGDTSEQGAGGDLSRMLEIDGVTHELVVLPDGVVFAFNRILSAG